jgi:hypothetical protein
MASLELQFNCLCLFVPDPENRVVHVLMPATHGHPGHEGHQHVVRMFQKSFTNGNEQLKGRDLAGWALTLGPDEASADTSLSLPPGAFKGGELPNLGKVTEEVKGIKAMVDRALVGPDPGPGVAARITLRSGGISRMASEATWRLGTRDYALAHQVVWRMSDVGQQPTWERLNAPPQAAQVEPPLQTLNGLEPEDDFGVKLRIYHVTDEALPPTVGILSPAVMQEHYRAHYLLLGEKNPANEQLPSIKGNQIEQVNCGAGQAPLKPSGG